MSSRWQTDWAVQGSPQAPTQSGQGSIMAWGILDKSLETSLDVILGGCTLVHRLLVRNLPLTLIASSPVLPCPGHRDSQPALSVCRVNRKYSKKLSRVPGPPSGVPAIFQSSFQEPKITGQLIFPKGNRDQTERGRKGGLQEPSCHSLPSNFLAREG